MRPCATLSEFHKICEVKKGVENFMKDVWTRKVLTSVNGLHVAKSKKGAQTMIECVRDFKSGYQRLLGPDQHVKMWGIVIRIVRTW